MKPVGYRRARRERRLFRTGDPSNGVEGAIHMPPVSRVPSRNTGQGASRHGEPKPKRRRRRETEFSQHCEEKRVKVRESWRLG